MSYFKLTDAQIKKSEIKRDKKHKQILEGIRAGKLNYFQCQQYLNITNETFHSPACYVLKYYPETEEVDIKAIFFGSGTFSHPVKYARVPKEAIMPESGYSLPVLLFLASVNWFKATFNKDFKALMDKEKADRDKLNEDYEYLMNRL